MTSAGNGKRQRHLGVREAEIERCVAAHGKPDHMRTCDSEMPQHIDNVFDGVRLAVVLDRTGYVRRRISASVERDAAIAARKEPHLLLPVATIARELVDE